MVKVKTLPRKAPQNDDLPRGTVQYSEPSAPTQQEPQDALELQSQPDQPDGQERHFHDSAHGMGKGPPAPASMQGEIFRRIISAFYTNATLFKERAQPAVRDDSQAQEPKQVTTGQTARTAGDVAAVNCEPAPPQKPAIVDAELAFSQQMHAMHSINSGVSPSCYMTVNMPVPGTSGRATSPAGPYVGPPSVTAGAAQEVPSMAASPMQVAAAAAHTAALHAAAPVAFAPAHGRPIHMPGPGPGIGPGPVHWQQFAKQIAAAAGHVIAPVSQAADAIHTAVQTAAGAGTPVLDGLSSGMALVSSGRPSWPPVLSDDSPVKTPALASFDSLSAMFPRAVVWGELPCSSCGEGGQCSIPGKESADALALLAGQALAEGSRETIDQAQLQLPISTADVCWDASAFARQELGSSAYASAPDEASRADGRGQLHVPATLLCKAAPLGNVPGMAGSGNGGTKQQAVASHTVPSFEGALPTAAAATTLQPASSAEGAQPRAAAAMALHPVPNVEEAQQTAAAEMVHDASQGPVQQQHSVPLVPALHVSHDEGIPCSLPSDAMLPSCTPQGLCVPPEVPAEAGGCSARCEQEAVHGGEEADDELDVLVASPPRETDATEPSVSKVIHDQHAPPCTAAEASTLQHPAEASALQEPACHAAFGSQALHDDCQHAAGQAQTQQDEQQSQGSDKAGGLDTQEVQEQEAMDHDGAGERGSEDRAPEQCVAPQCSGSQAAWQGRQQGQHADQQAQVAAEPDRRQGCNAGGVGQRGAGGQGLYVQQGNGHQGCGAGDEDEQGGGPRECGRGNAEGPSSGAAVQESRSHGLHLHPSEWGLEELPDAVRRQSAFITAAPGSQGNRSGDGTLQEVGGPVLRRSSTAASCDPRMQDIPPAPQPPPTSPATQAACPPQSTAKQLWEEVLAQCADLAAEAAASVALEMEHEVLQLRERLNDEIRSRKVVEQQLHDAQGSCQQLRAQLKAAQLAAEAQRLQGGQPVSGRRSATKANASQIDNRDLVRKHADHLERILTRTLATAQQHVVMLDDRCTQLDGLMQPAAAPPLALKSEKRGPSHDGEGSAPAAGTRGRDQPTAGPHAVRGKRGRSPCVDKVTDRGGENAGRRAGGVSGAGDVAKQTPLPTVGVRRSKRGEAGMQQYPVAGAEKVSRRASGGTPSSPKGPLGPRQVPGQGVQGDLRELTTKLDSAKKLVEMCCNEVQQLQRSSHGFEAQFAEEMAGAQQEFRFYITTNSGLVAHIAQLEADLAVLSGSGQPTAPLDKAHSGKGAPARPPSRQWPEGSASDAGGGVANGSRAFSAAGGSRVAAAAAAGTIGDGGDHKSTRVWAVGTTAIVHRGGPQGGRKHGRGPGRGRAGSSGGRAVVTGRGAPSPGRQLVNHTVKSGRGGPVGQSRRPKIIAIGGPGVLMPRSLPTGAGRARVLPPVPKPPPPQPQPPNPPDPDTDARTDVTPRVSRRSDADGDVEDDDDEDGVEGSGSRPRRRRRVDYRAMEAGPTLET